MARWRGGANAHAEVELGEIRTEDPQRAREVETGLRSVSHEDFVHYALEASGLNFSGIVDGAEYRAAYTVGDGACALHAVFGIPAPGSGQIGYDGVRSLVVQGLPRSWAELAAAQNAYLCDAAGALLETETSELILQAARREVLSEAPNPSREAAIAWRQLSGDIQEEVKNFVETQAVESETQTAWDQRLKESYSMLFTTDKEAS